MQTAVLQRLCGGLWHTTHPDRFQGILKSGAILPEPDIPDSERWKTSQGRELYPFVRILGGVSLFDFLGFDAEKYSNEYRLSSWEEFVPYRRTWRCAIWIEIDRTKIATNFINGPDLVARWKKEEAYKHTIMPVIEAAHIGPLLKNAFKGAFIVRDGDDQIRDYPF